MEQSSGEYICFLDADDVMMERRIELQLAMAREHPYNIIVGAGYTRIPEGESVSISFIPEGESVSISHLFFGIQRPGGLFTGHDCRNVSDFLS